MNITGPSDREGNLIVSINGTKYVVTLDRSGNATLDVSGLAPGNYNVDITYIENDKYNAKEFNNIAFIIVEPKDDAIINISDVVITYGDVAVINASLHYSTAGENVVIIVVGKGSKVATIDANGTAIAEFDDFTRPGNPNFNPDFEKMYEKDPTVFMRYKGIFSELYDSAWKNGNIYLPFRKEGGGSGKRKEERKGRNYAETE